jgi:hypothetical protein
VEDGWWIDALQSTEGERLLEELARQSVDPANELRLVTALRERYPVRLVTAALVQTGLRARARSKFTRASQMFFTREGLEQASSERMARHHATRLAPFASVVDLCTGIGGDLIGLSKNTRTIGVDRDPVHARLACINADVNGCAANTTCVCADVRCLELSRVPAIFVDPARRTEGRRMRAGTSEPPLRWCFALADDGKAVGIKAAPGLPLDLVPDRWEIEFVSEQRELKESLLWSPAVATSTRRATVLPDRHTLAAQADAALPVAAPGMFLLDPDPAVTRAGLVAELGALLGECWKIDDEVGFLSADFAMRTPFGRTLRIEASMPWSLARLRDALRSLGVGRIDIRKRGSAVDVDELQRRLKLRGTRPATVVLTRVSNRPWALVCSSLSEETAT